MRFNDTLIVVFSAFLMTDRKLNVLYISDTSNKKINNSGFRPVIINCAKACQTYHILFPLHKNHGVLTEKIGDNITLEPANARGGLLCIMLKSTVVGIRRLRQFDKNHPSVITVFQPFECGLIGFMISRLTGTPLNVELRNDYFSEPYSSHTFWSDKKLANRMRYLFARWLLRRADSVLSVAGGRMSKSLVDFGVKPERIHILPTVVDTADFTPASPREFTKETLEIVSLTRLHKQKNVLLLIKAFDRAASRMPNLKLTLVGIKLKKNNLSTIFSNTLREAKNKDKITVLPWSQDTPDHLKQADIYALSSDYEGCARVLTEAMAAGLPNVTKHTQHLSLIHISEPTRPY